MCLLSLAIGRSPGGFFLFPCYSSDHANPPTFILKRDLLSLDVCSCVPRVENFGRLGSIYRPRVVNELIAATLIHGAIVVVFNYPRCVF